MEQLQKWRVDTRAGNSFDLFTPLGLSFDQALASAGLMWQDIASITQQGVQFRSRFGS